MGLPAGYRQRGLGLPEALLALALLGVALAGLLAAQWQAGGLQAEAMSRRHAGWLLTDLGQRMALNPQARPEYLRLLQTGAPALAPASDPCARDDCPAEARARADVSYFASEALRLLHHPGWRLESCPASPGQCLRLAWSAASGRMPPCWSAAAGQPARQARCLLRELP